MNLVYSIQSGPTVWSSGVGSRCSDEQIRSLQEVQFAGPTAAYQASCMHVIQLPLECYTTTSPLDSLFCIRDSETTNSLVLPDDVMIICGRQDALGLPGPLEDIDYR